MSRRVLLAVLVSTASLVGCLGESTSSSEARDIRGTWRYTADQIAPPLTITGTLRVTEQSGGDVVGEATIEERTVTGSMSVLGAVITGRVLGTSDVDLDVRIASDVRRHVGRIVADTLRGTWVNAASGATGSFMAVLDR